MGKGRKGNKLLFKHSNDLKTVKMIKINVSVLLSILFRKTVALQSYS